MNFSVLYLERHSADTPSIERLFSCIAGEMESLGVSTNFKKVSGGNGFLGILINLWKGIPDTGDLFHITGHINYMGLRLPRDRTILTVHDATVLQARTGLRRWLIRKLYFELPVRRLKYITAISEATKSEIIRLSGVEADRITVIENPLLISSIDEIPNKKTRAFPVVLQIGTAPHKNLEGTIQALRSIPSVLRIIGPVDQALKQKLSVLPRWISLEGLTDDEVVTEYDKADVLVYCSTKEGFGLPIIEAQARGLPVITSDIEPMRSVSGNGAVLVDPYDPDVISRAVGKILEDQEFRHGLITSGFENVKRFNSQTIANEYLGLYKKIAENKKL